MDIPLSSVAQTGGFFPLVTLLIFYGVYLISVVENGLRNNGIGELYLQ